MSKGMMKEPYAFSVLQIISELHGHTTGSYADGTDGQEKYDWLNWRLNEGWEPSKSLNTGWSITEDLIKALGFVVLGNYVISHYEG